jgi:hypothetical protein
LNISNGPNSVTIHRSVNNVVHRKLQTQNRTAIPHCTIFVPEMSRNLFCRVNPKGSRTAVSKIARLMLGAVAARRSPVTK